MSEIINYYQSDIPVPVHQRPDADAIEQTDRRRWLRNNTPLLRTMEIVPETQILGEALSLLVEDCHECLPTSQGCPHESRTRVLLKFRLHSSLESKMNIPEIPLGIKKIVRELQRVFFMEWIGPDFQTVQSMFQTSGDRIEKKIAEDPNLSQAVSYAMANEEVLAPLWQTHLDTLPQH